MSEPVSVGGGGAIDAALMGPGEMLYEAARELGLVRDIRSWRAREYTENYNGAQWKCRTPGLSQAERARWNKLAAIRAPAPSEEPA